MDYMKRWAANVLLSEVISMLVHASSTLMRCMNWYKAGMSEKEQLYLEKRIITLDKVWRDLRVLHIRLRKTNPEYGRLGAP